MTLPMFLRALNQLTENVLSRVSHAGKLLTQSIAGALNGIVNAGCSLELVDKIEIHAGRCGMKSDRTSIMRLTMARRYDALYARINVSDFRLHRNAPIESALTMESACAMKNAQVIPCPRRR